MSCCEDLTDATLRKLGACCSELRLLEAVGCSHFTDSGFQALSNVSGINSLNLRVWLCGRGFPHPGRILSHL